MQNAKWEVHHLMIGEWSVTCKSPKNEGAQLRS
jgi:hypothetical protein